MKIWHVHTHSTYSRWQPQSYCVLLQQLIDKEDKPDNNLFNDTQKQQQNYWAQTENNRSLNEKQKKNWFHIIPQATIHTYNSYYKKKKLKKKKKLRERERELLKHKQKITKLQCHSKNNSNRNSKKKIQA